MYVRSAKVKQLILTSKDQTKSGTFAKIAEKSHSGMSKKMPKQRVRLKDKKLDYNKMKQALKAFGDVEVAIFRDPYEFVAIYHDDVLVGIINIVGGNRLELTTE